MEDFLSRLDKRILSETQGVYPRVSRRGSGRPAQPQVNPSGAAASGANEGERRARILDMEEQLLRLRLANERRKGKDTQARDLKRLGGVEPPGKK